MEDIDLFDLERRATDTDQAHRRQPDRVRAGRRACGKDAMADGVEERRDDEAWLADIVQVVDQRQVAEALEIEEGVRERRLELDRAADAGSAAAWIGIASVAVKGVRITPIGRNVTGASCSAIDGDHDLSMKSCQLVTR